MKTDILVIGGGLAGRRCAEEAGKTADVTLVCDGAGASPFIHGMNVPLYKDDSVECFKEDTLRSGKYQNNLKLVEALCSGSLNIAKEFEFDKKDGNYSLLKPLGSSYPRAACIGGFTGTAVLRQIEEKRNFNCMKHIRALKLAREKKRVCGAYCFDTKEKKYFFIGAKAVVIASGGFCGLFPFSTNTSDIAGDGIAMALDSGAVLRDMEFIQFEPSAAVYPKKISGKSVITTMLFDGAVIKNNIGEKIVKDGECVDKDELSRLIYSEIEQGRGSRHGGVYFDARGVNKKVMQEKYKIYRKRYLDVNIDILKTPVEIASAPHTSLGGIEINERCETSVEGLFACGEAAGGLHGANRLGGNAGLEVLVFGKTAGKSAAEFVKKVPEPQEYSEEEFVCESNTDEEYGSELKEILSESMNVVRNGEKLLNAKKNLKNMLNQLKSDKICFKRTRIYNDALCAYAAVLSALAREESVGCHTRSDSRPTGKKYCIRVKNDGGEISVQRGEI